MTNRIRRLIAPLILVHASIVLILIYLPAKLVIHAETAGARFVGTGFVLLLAGSLVAWAACFRKKRLMAVVVTALCLSLASICFLGALHIAPTGVMPSDSNFTQIRRGQLAFKRHSLVNIVPEIDQLKLGSYLFRYVDPIIDGKQSGRIRRLLLSVYREMRHDPAFVAAGSALGLCYEDILTGKRRVLHYYQYIPKQLNRPSYPVLVFVHGSLGNFKGYMWVLKSLADSTGYAVIAPSFGCGNWRLDRNCSVLDSVYNQCAKDPLLDHQSMVLAGLSNGGLGVTREMQLHGDRYQGFVLISPVMDCDAVASPQLRKNTGRKPLLLIHGEDDRRIPCTYVRQIMTRLRYTGLKVTTHYYPAEDHFLLFAERASVMADIEKWLVEKEIVNAE